MSGKNRRDTALYLRLMKRAGPYRWHLFGIFLIGLLATPIALLTPVPLKIAVDNVIGGQPLEGPLAVLPDELSAASVLVLAVALLLVVSLLAELQKAGDTMLRTYTGEKLLLRFRSELFRHIQRLSFSYADQRGTADTVYRIQYDAESIRSVAIETVIPFVTAALTATAMIVVTARIDWQLALVAMAVAPPMLITFGVFRRRLRKRSREVRRLESAAFSVIHEVLSAFRVVKAFGQEDRESKRFLDRSNRGVRGRMRLVIVEGAFGILIAAISAAGTGLVLYIGVTHVTQGLITLGDLLLVMGYLTLLYAPLQTMSRRVARLQNHLAGAERAFALLDVGPDVVEVHDARPLARAEGAIEFRNVTFQYREDEPVFHHVDLEVPAGTSVGIRGATGAGKTTLVSLLNRFYDPTEGSILLDGVDLRSYKLADLRDQFALVLQEPVLFSATIAENIAYGRPSASRDEIVAAAKTAGAHEFIAAASEGYDTEVGERGMTLSGGERQRISVARAFLKDAPILILDEPTSSVDVLTERTMMKALSELMRGRTTFVISHRTSTLGRCDLLVEVDHGRLRPISDKREIQSSHHRHKVTSEHPAAVAWRGLEPHSGSPSHIETVVRPTAKREVFRLVGAGPGGTSVIAKRTLASALSVERLVYEKVMPALPVGSPEFYGYIEDDQRAWIFLEDVGERRFSESDPVQRAAAARWLAGLHVSASELDVVRGLPAIGPDRYLDHLRSARQRIEENRDNPALSSRDDDLLAAWLDHLDTIEGSWATVESLCETIPNSLVHADFQSKNAYVRESDGVTGLLLIDWETAGIGPLAPDLAPVRGWQWKPRIDVDAYSSIARERWPDLDPGAVGQLVKVGGVLQQIAAIDWACAHLSHAWPEKATSTLRRYAPDIEQVLATLR